jgi:hypothetical protein
VLEPHSGHLFNLSALEGRDYPVQSGEYTYHLSVCGGLQRGICTHKDTGNDRVASCQVKGAVQKIAGERQTDRQTDGRTLSHSFASDSSQFIQSSLAFLTGTLFEVGSVVIESVSRF